MRVEVQSDGVSSYVVTSKAQQFCHEPSASRACTSTWPEASAEQTSAREGSLCGAWPAVTSAIGTSDLRVRWGDKARIGGGGKIRRSSPCWGEACSLPWREGRGEGYRSHRLPTCRWLSHALCVCVCVSRGARYVGLSSESPNWTELGSGSGIGTRHTAPVLTPTHMYSQ